MKILHTSDWHLGKRLMERERLPEQAEALEELAALCEKERVDLVLVAGDVFDTYLPPAEAEELFFRAVKKLAGNDRAVVVISGNHDDGVRLAAASPIAAEEGVYIFGGQKKASFSSANRPVRAVEGGENYLIIENGAGERVYLNILPYPNEARLREEKSEESYAEKTLRWIIAGDEHYDGTLPHIFLSHLFVAGGSVSESERDIALGGARAVPVCNLPEGGYTALGHLHRKQKLGKNIWYSGSLLQYSFDEANTEKYVLLLETEKSEVRLVKEIPVSAGKRLVRLEASGAAEALPLLASYEGAFIELTLHLREPLTSQETHALREANAGLVSLITLVEGGPEAPVVSRATLSAGELFCEYYRSQYGVEPSRELTERFLLLLEEGA